MSFSDASNFSDDYERLKSKLLNLCKERAVKTIMLTSCNEGDGVSTTAHNLATALASGYMTKVLLVDLNPNMRNANTSKSGASNDILSLIENVKSLPKQQDDHLPNTLSATPGEIFVVASKPGLVCSSNLVQSESFKNLIDLFKAQFDYVILDAPPVSASSGCLALGAQVDGVVLVLRSEHTRQGVAKNAREQLEDAGAKMLGAIINMKKYYIPAFIYRRL